MAWLLLKAKGNNLQNTVMKLIGFLLRNHCLSILGVEHGLSRRHKKKTVKVNIEFFLEMLQATRTVRNENALPNE